MIDNPIPHDAPPWVKASIAMMVREKYQSKLIISARVLTGDDQFKEPAWVGEVLDREMENAP